MAWLASWFGISHNCSVWSHVVGQNRQSDEEHDKGSVEEGFQLSRMKFDRVGEGDREVLGMGYCGINVLEGSELKLA